MKQLSSQHILGIVALLLAALYAYFSTSINFLIKLVNALIHVKYHAITTHGKYFSYADVFEARVDAHPNRVQFITVEDNKSVTLLDLEKEANKIAHWSLKQNYKRRDTVALMMLNRPSIASFFIGMSKVGVATALLNTNAAGKAFVHVVQVATQDSDTKIVIVDDELRNQIANDIPALEALGITCLFWEKDVLSAINTLNISDIRPNKSLRKDVRENDPLIYIFTSGTTGILI